MPEISKQMVRLTKEDPDLNPNWRHRPSSVAMPEQQSNPAVKNKKSVAGRQ
jgi:hypothetical protein